MLLNPQVIIVGAGLSGLRAATQVRDHGLSYVVLEAMDRPGGKVFSMPAVNDSSGDTGVVDLGAAWLNDSGQSKIYELAVEYGIELVEQRVTGLSLEEDSEGVKSFPYGEASADTSIEAFILYLLVELIDPQAPHLIPFGDLLDSMTALEFSQKVFKGNDVAEHLISFLSRATLGVEANELSALFWLDYMKSGGGLGNIASDREHGAQYLRATQGFATITGGLAEDLDIEYSSPVTKIVQEDDSVTVEISNGTTYSAQKVIFSPPTSLYSLVDFRPKLPKNKSILSNSTLLGYYSKTILVFSEPWWRSANLSGVFTSDGPINFSRDTSAGNQYSITCFHVGEPGREWSRLSADERQEAVLDQYRRAFGTVADRVPDPIQIHEKDWSKEPWIQGAPSPVMPPGILTGESGQSLREPFGHVHFIGTETAIEWKGYLEGAVRAGDRGAQEVIELLKKKPCRRRAKSD